MERSNKGKGRGFASMDPEQQREIASKGGKAAHEKGTAHEFDSKSAAEAGRKGGKASHGSDNSRENQGNQGNQGGSRGE
jgi:general stress protein YciG